MKIKDYQIEVLDALRKKRAAGSKRALVVMASGLGKTATSAFDVEAFMNERGKGRVLYLCHNNAILAQSMEAYRDILGDDYSYGLYNGREKEEDVDCLFASFQTMRLHKKDFSKKDFDYVVVDESHHAPARTYRGVIDYFEPSFLLGLTATPRRLDGARLDKLFGDPVCDFGLSDAIKKGLLVKVNYRLMLDEMSDIGSITAEGKTFSTSELNRRLFVPIRDSEIAKVIQREKVGHSMLVYCCTIEHAANMHALIPGSGLVHSKQSPVENDKVLKAFRDKEINVLVSVDMLNEGIDIPHADTIVFLRSTVSPIVFQQQLGRGLRLCEGKTHTTVLDFVANCERLIAINDLMDEVTEGGVGDYNDEKFMLEIKATQFEERVVSLYSIVSRINELTKVITDDEIILEIQRIAKILGRTPRIKDFQEMSNIVSIATIRWRFGSWVEALVKAGLVNVEDLRRRQDLITQVQELARDLGRAPSAFEFDRDIFTDSVAAVLNEFENWNNFLRSAGFPIDQRVITNSEVKNWKDKMRQRYESTGELPTEEDLLMDVGSDNFDRVISAYGGWYYLLHSIIGYTVEDLVRWAERCIEEKLKDEEISFSCFKEAFGESGVRLMEEHFSSWGFFIRETIGVDAALKREMKEKLKRVAKMLDRRAPSPEEFDSTALKGFTDRHDSVLAVELFGSWEEFVARVGLSHYSREQIIDDIRRVAKDLGRMPDSWEFTKLSRTISAQAIKRQLGDDNWLAVLYEAGFDVTFGFERYYAESMSYLATKLREIYEKKGRLPSGADLRSSDKGGRISPYTLATIKSYLGSWDNVLRYVGLIERDEFKI